MFAKTWFDLTMTKPEREQKRDHCSFGSLQNLTSSYSDGTTFARTLFRMIVRFAVVSVLLLTCLVHGEKQAAAKSAGMANKLFILL